MLLTPYLGIKLRPMVYNWIQQMRGVRPSIKIGKERFQLTIDVRQFAKEEIRVKARPEYVIIEGKQEKKMKNGYVMRHFVRKFKLPHGCDPCKMKTNLSPNGLLTVTAPRCTCDINMPCETVIPITFTESKEDDLITVQRTDEKPKDQKP
ncbi:unnamed protein product [Diatraea saccharalis]|uniref:SHSP domain-containing protein n=1 Tax=Diatraea saccharalis TaxID=40085 RepID=A0A9N9RFW6_9NEOP|nr:unnamed protein product [Diatraea saccharalis]